MAHVSATERFTDDGFHEVTWTAELALKVAQAGGYPEHARAAAVDRIRDAIDDGRLPAAAVDALVAAGWTELDD